MKRLYALLALLAIATFALAGCGATHPERQLPEVGQNEIADSGTPPSDTGPLPPGMGGSGGGGTIPSPPDDGGGGGSTGPGGPPGPPSFE